MSAVRGGNDLTESRNKANRTVVNPQRCCVPKPFVGNTSIIAVWRLAGRRFRFGEPSDIVAQLSELMAEAGQGEFEEIQTVHRCVEIRVAHEIRVLRLQVGFTGFCKPKLKIGMVQQAVAGQVELGHQITVSTGDLHRKQIDILAIEDRVVIKIAIWAFEQIVSADGFETFTAEDSFIDAQIIKAAGQSQVGGVIVSRRRRGSAETWAQPRRARQGPASPRSKRGHRENIWNGMFKAA